MSSLIKYSFINFFGKRLIPKIVVIESDDWGTIRMSSKEAFQNLLKKGYPVDQCAYNTNDGLESNKDLEVLFEVLSSIKGADGKPAVLTANNIVANPDFQKIKEAGFQEYYFELFTETLKRYPAHDRVIDLYQQGIKEGVVKPQFHGREHVHIPHWLDGLRNGESKALDTFSHEMFSVYLGQGSTCNKEYLNAMAFYNSSQKEKIEESVTTGLQLFESIWGFKSETVIAPCYQWHSDLEQTFSFNGIKIIQGGRAQISPSFNKEGNKTIRHFNGQKNKFNQTYTVRNVVFEPSTDKNKDWVDSSLKEVSNAFFWQQPAIISSHRLNYIGWLNPKNREVNLLLLNDLLKKIVKQWPDVIFISSDQVTKYYK
jgi:hypothetical protein